MQLNGLSSPPRRNGSEIKQAVKLQGARRSAFIGQVNFWQNIDLKLCAK